MFCRTRGSIEDAEDLVSSPWKMWGLGVAAALLPIAYGARCIVWGRAPFLGNGGPMWVTGPAATALGIAYVALGGFLHFRFFWELAPRLCRVADLGKGISLIVFLAALGYAVAQVLVVN